MNKSTTRKRFKVKKIKEKHLQNAKVKGFLYTEHSFAYQNTTKTNTQSIENHVASSWPSYSKCCFMAACRVSLSHAEPSGRHSVFQPPCFCFRYFVWGGGGCGFLDLPGLQFPLDGYLGVRDISSSSLSTNISMVEPLFLHPFSQTNVCICTKYQKMLPLTSCWN